MTTNRYSFTDLKVLAVLLLYEELARDTNRALTIIDCKQRLGERASLNLLRQAMQANNEDELVYFSKAAEDNSDWRLTRKGIERAENFIKSQPTLYKIVSDALGATSAPDSKSSDIAGEENWEPLPLDRDGKNFDAAVTATENALKEIEGNNGFAQSDPEKRNQIVWSLKEGLTIVKNGLPNRSQINAFIVAPLKFIAEKFSASVIGEAAKIALKAIATWLGIPF